MHEFVPGVTDTGFFNQHFVRDIGIIQLFFGMAFAIGMIRPQLPDWAVGRGDGVARRARRFHLWEVAVGILLAVGNPP